MIVIFIRLRDFILKLPVSVSKPAILLKYVNVSVSSIHFPCNDSVLIYAGAQRLGYHKGKFSIFSRFFPCDSSLLYQRKWILKYSGKYLKRGQKIVVCLIVNIGPFNVTIEGLYFSFLLINPSSLFDRLLQKLI